MTRAAAAVAPFEFQTATRMVFGRDALERVPALVRELDGAAAIPIRWRLDPWEGPQLPTTTATIAGNGRSRLKLRRDYGLCCAGLLDLSQLAACTLADGARPWCLPELG